MPPVNNNPLTLLHRTAIPHHGQVVFDHIREALLSGRDAVDLRGLPYASALEAPNVWQLVLLDEPRLMRFTGRATTHYVGGTPVELILETSYDHREERRRLREIDSIVERLLRKMDGCGSTYEKAEVAYRSIIAAVDYNAGIGSSQTMDSVFLKRQSCCSGYSHAYQYVLSRAGIPCAYVDGTTEDGGRHAWNIADIDGRRCWVDVTWGDPIMHDGGSTINLSELDSNNPNSVRMDYFCTPNSEFRRTHMPNLDVARVVGRLDDGAMDWYRVHGLLFDGNYSSEQIVNAIQADLLKREVLGEHDAVATISLKFPEQVAYNEAREKLFARNGMMRLARPVFAAYNIDIIGNINLSENKDLGVLHFSFLKQRR